MLAKILTSLKNFPCQRSIPPQSRQSLSRISKSLLSNYSMNREQRFYKLEQEYIRWTVDHNNFQLFFSYRDARPIAEYKKYRQTDQLGEGYRQREKLTKKLMSIFKQIYGVKGKITKDSELFYYAINESGLSKKEKAVHKDSGHNHLLIGFKPSSKWFYNPAGRIQDFENYLKGQPVDCLKRKNGNRHYWSN